MNTGAYLEKKVWIQGHLGEITDLEFENHKSVKKCIFCTLEQAWANICSIGYQNSNFKMGLSLFGCAEKYIEQSTHCAMYPTVQSVHRFPRHPNHKDWLLLLRNNLKHYILPSSAQTQCLLWYLHCWWRISRCKRAKRLWLICSCAVQKWSGRKSWVNTSAGLIIHKTN